MATKPTNPSPAATPPIPSASMAAAINARPPAIFGREFLIGSSCFNANDNTNIPAAASTKATPTKASPAPAARTPSPTVESNSKATTTTSIVFAKILRDSSKRS